MNFNNINHPKGKVVYYIPAVKMSFENSKDKRDGSEKAKQYCLDNFIDSNTIIKFDSRLERDRYEYLKDLEQKGQITQITHHFVFQVLNAFENVNNENIEAITYESDFSYIDTQTGKRIIEDVKGSEYFLDDKFMMIKKIFDYFMKPKGLYLKVVMFKNKQWVEWKIGDKKKPQTLIKKQREQIKNLKKENHEKEILENKRNREIKRIKELEQKDKLTKKEKERLFTLKNRWGI